MGGKWVRSYFEVKAHAESFAQVENTELLNRGIQGAAFSLALRAVTKCEARQAPFGKTLRDAVDFYMPHPEP